MSLISYHSCVFLQLLATMQAFIAHSCVVVCFIAFKLHWSFKNVYNAELCCSLHLFNLFCFRLHCHFFAIGVYNSTTFFIRQTLMLLWQFAHIVISFKLTFHVLNSQFFDTFTMSYVECTFQLEQFSFAKKFIACFISYFLWVVEVITKMCFCVRKDSNSRSLNGAMANCLHSCDCPYFL